MTAAGFGYACALVLAIVLAAAAIAKIRGLPATEASFASLGLPRAATMARVVPVAEAGTAAVLVLTPALGAMLALALLAFFTTFLGSRLLSGVRAPCACFGSSSREPISPANLVGNAFLLLLAVGALVAAAPTVPSLADLAVLTGAGAAAILVHGVVRRRTPGPPSTAARGYAGRS